MFVAELDLTDFRSYEKSNISFAPGITALIGPNGVGKTNLVEAIYYAATLNSHRVSSKVPLIKSGAERAIIRLRARNDQRTSIIELDIPQSGSGRARINGGQVIPIGQTRGIIRTIMFSPEDIGIAKGEPETRRRFLDELVLQARPALAGYYRDYEQVLRQRNAYLKNARQLGNPSDGVLDILTEQLIEFGTEISVARLLVTKTLQPLVTKHYQQIADANTALTLEITQGSSDAALPVDVSISELLGADEQAEAQVKTELRSAYVQQFQSKQAGELARGYTLVGPHRDDLALALDGLPAKGYASHGESWSLALALKLAAFDYLAAQYANFAPPDASIVAESSERSHQPILILDDVFAELDEKRRASLSAAIESIEQVLITSAVASDIPKALDVQVRTVAKGSVT